MNEMELLKRMAYELEQMKDMVADTCFIDELLEQYNTLMGEIS